MKAERCGGRWFDRVFIVFFLFPFVAPAQRCSFPNDFSHRSSSLEAWVGGRGKAKVWDKWGDGKSWSKIHKLLSSRGNASDWEFNKSEEHAKEFTKWVSAISRTPSSPEKYEVMYRMRPWWKMEGSQVLSSYSVGDLREGDTILDIPVRLLISDKWTVGDRTSLHDWPWEVRLAAKLLRERSRGDLSAWAPYMKLLPNFVPLPLFFSDLELNNVQDRSIKDEVLLLRKFVKTTYQALHVEEIAGGKFSEYAWALSIVYSSACQVDRRKSKAGKDSSHFLVPFFGSSFGTRGQVFAKYEDEGLKLVSSDLKGGLPLAAEYASSTMRDTFIFRGFIPDISQQDNIRVFHDVLDLVDWYSSTYGAVNNNRYLTWRLARDAVKTLAAYLPQQEATSPDSWNLNGTNFTVGASGFVDYYMTSIFATLSHAKQALGTDMGVTTVDLILRNGTTVWESVMQSIAVETVSRYRWSMMDCKISSSSSLQFAFKSAKSIVLQRLITRLDSFSTDLTEDQILLEVASWEGMNELAGEQLACPSCRWQTEQMSLHDNLALRFRFSIKKFLTEMISAISCGANITRDMTQMTKETRPGEEDGGSLQKFLDWCAGHDLTISQRLAISDILVPAQDEFSPAFKVRGVVALEDIPQGETLFSLPMTVGLYNNDSVSAKSAIDAWDYAAARLLREKAKGNESDWAPYIAILPDYLPTPIHLDSRELMEVQWWPVMRELVQVRKAIKESYTQLNENELALANYSEYKWAVTMVHSRAFTLPVKPDEQYEQYVLMPSMDMINHHYHYKADWMSQPVWDGKLDIVAKRTVQKGEELFASFGPRTNDNLFLYYGFVLEDNPFDAVPLFGSFEEALRWFRNIWTNDCFELMDSQLEVSRCQQKTWYSFWHRIKDSVEEAETGSGPQGSEWGELLNRWADLGLQFLPYQPGPTIYPGGIVDPSFLSVFSSSYQMLHTMRKENGVDSPWPDSCPQCERNSSVGSLAMRTIFRCLENESKRIEGLLDGIICKAELTDVFLIEETNARASLAARISVVLRCKEILSSFPTTSAEDRELLRGSLNTCTEDYSSCRSSQIISSHLQLTRRYRYMKKLLLQAPMDKLLN